MTFTPPSGRPVIRVIPAHLARTIAAHVAELTETILAQQKRQSGTPRAKRSRPRRRRGPAGSGAPPSGQRLTFARLVAICAENGIDLDPQAQTAEVAAPEET